MTVLYALAAIYASMLIAFGVALWLAPDEHVLWPDDHGDVG